MRDPEVTSKIMSRVKSRNTRPELIMRSALHRRGLRYRLETALPGKPDITFMSARVAVFANEAFIRWKSSSRAIAIPTFGSKRSAEMYNEILK
jgi:DNA mismatch endonuclease (patch repair protein)